VLDHQKPAGLGTATLPDSGALYVPVSVGERTLAVLEITGEGAAGFRDPEKMQLLETFAQQTAAALERARLAAEGRRAEHLAELSRLKSRFVSVASHELDDPLDELERAVGEIDRRVRASGATTDVATDRLLRDARESMAKLRTLTRELLDLSRFEAGAVDLELEDLAPMDIVRAAVAAAEPVARQMGKTLLADSTTELPLVRADPAQVQRALGNLVDNALRFAKHRVVVSTDVLPDFVQISVADDGPGIPVADQERIFEPFLGEGSRESVGLGLAIVREIVRAHGGDVWVDSGPGPGSVFSFNLPLANHA
jgi:K+-sensing histidine kinase KdpD